MAGIEDLLREELRAQQPPAPGRDAMLARVTRVRRRRVAGAAVGCGVVLVGAALVAASVIPRGPAGAPAGGDVPPRVYTTELINTIFTDHQHGYVVQQQCSADQTGEVPIGQPTPDIHQECTTRLLATADGGETWQTRSVPADPATKDAGVHLNPGHSLMLWIDAGGRLAFGGWHRRYWTTQDAGVTWLESPSPREVGPGGSFGTFGPGDTLTFLDTAPPAGIGAKGPVLRASDGSFWVAAADAVAVTRDHGLTWQTLPTLDSVNSVDWVSTANGQTVYASVHTAAGPRLARSTDGGTTWTEALALAAPGACGLVLANGDVILAEASEVGGVFRLRAGTQTLERLTGVPAHPQSLYTSGGVVVVGEGWDQRPDPYVDSVVSVSPDGGTTWRAVPVPVG